MVWVSTNRSASASSMPNCSPARNWCCCSSPKALAELEEIADAVARWAAPDVVLVAGGRVKHMTPRRTRCWTQLARVQPQRAERKPRLIVCRKPCRSRSIRRTP